MKTYTLPLNSTDATLETTGGKGASLARMVNARLPVPDGFHVTTEAYKAFVRENDLQPHILQAVQAVDANQPVTLEAASQTIAALFTKGEMPTAIATTIENAYTNLKSKIQNPKCPVAVRSSATAEDLPHASFAGQQDTYLNIQGADAVLDAVKRCWASLWTARAIGYRARQAIAPDAVSLAVVVQALIPAEVAGVLFTANPINGRRDQIAINAAWGLGESIVGGMVTPDTYIVNKAGGAVTERTIANKHAMVVRTADGTAEEFVPADKRNAPTLTDAQVAELAELGTRIESHYGMPMDIEWTLCEGDFAIVQARPITALPELTLDPPTEWPLPHPKGQYMRSSIVDLMHDPLSPLFISLGLPAISAQMGNAMHKLLGKDVLLPDPYFLSINGYAYQNGHMTPKMLWSSLTILLPAFGKLMRAGIPLWRDHALPLYRECVQRWEAQALDTLTASELLTGVQDVVDAAMYNLTIQMTWLGACAGSELLFTNVYNRLIKRNGEPDATTFLMGYNSTPIQAEKARYDLAMWSQNHTTLADYLADTPSVDIATQLNNSTPPEGIDDEIWAEFQARFDAYQHTFGHIIYDLDFAKPLPRDNPAVMLDSVKLYLRGEGKNPHTRQKASETQRIEAEEHILKRVKRLKRWSFTKSLDWAQSLAAIREDGLAAIGTGYPVLREMLRELGRRLAETNVVEDPDDVFWLEFDELKVHCATLNKSEAPKSLARAVRTRKATWRAAKSVTAPPMLPAKKRFLGFSMDGIVAADESEQTGDTLKGIGSSAGTVTAPACVLHGPEDFGTMRSGDVLVAGITTPAWTPLFAMASAVVTDVGGPLSHGSIVAREYGIPAVMGTGVATKRIANGQTITVDGDKGLVRLGGSE